MRRLWWLSACLLCGALWACPGEFRFRDDAGAASGCPAAGCPYSLVCSSTLDRCVECTSDVQCRSPSPRCDVSRGRCVECLGSSDCPMGSACEREKTHRCVATCVPDAGTCAAGVCHRVEDLTICDACVNEQLCRQAPGAGHCEEATGTCVRCSEDEHCSAPTPECDRRTGTCVECVDSRDCDGGTFCVAGACRAP